MSDWDTIESALKAARRHAHAHRRGGLADLYRLAAEALEAVERLRPSHEMSDQEKAAQFWARAQNLGIWLEWVGGEGMHFDRWLAFPLEGIHS